MKGFLHPCRTVFMPKWRLLLTVKASTNFQIVHQASFFCGLCLSQEIDILIKSLFRLKPGGRRNEKAGLEERTDVLCYYMLLVFVSLADTHALECVQTCRHSCRTVQNQHLGGLARTDASVWKPQFHSNCCHYSLLLSSKQDSFIATN